MKHLAAAAMRARARARDMAQTAAHGANIDPAEAVTEEIDWFVFTKRTEPPRSAKRGSNLAPNRSISANERPLGVSKA